MSKEKRGSKETMAKAALPYDSVWKEIIKDHLESFLEFFFEEIHRDIDFAGGYEFLSHELRNIAHGNKIEKRIVDALVKVHLKDGSQKYICIFIHIEVQETIEPGFMVRIYIYNYRIFGKNNDQDIEVISLAVLADEDESYRPSEYYVNRWGFEQKMKIPIVKIIDYKIKRELSEKLEQSSNPMAILVKAQLQSYDAKRSDNKEKFTIKMDLLKQCFARGYTQKQIESLIKFIDWSIPLPAELETRLSDEIAKNKEGHRMTYITSWERIAKIKGMKEGKREGRREGKKEGKLETARELLKNGVSIDIICKSTGFPREKIEKLVAAVHQVA